MTPNPNFLLNEDDIIIDACWSYSTSPTIEINCGKPNLEEAVILKQQILDTQQKAKKWDELIAEYTDVKTGELKEGVLQQILSDHKLRRLVDEELQSGQDGRITSSRSFLEELLKESKT